MREELVKLDAQTTADQIRKSTPDYKTMIKENKARKSVFGTKRKVQNREFTYKEPLPSDAETLVVSVPTSQVESFDGVSPPQTKPTRKSQLVNR